MYDDEQYNSLYQLVEQNAEADKLFYSLPDYVKDSIQSRADNVRSLRELKSYAENLTRGDL